MGESTTTDSETQDHTNEYNIDHKSNEGPVKENTSASNKEENHDNTKTLEENDSNYVQNIKMSYSDSGLSLKDKENGKDKTLLSDSKTIVRFSPAWRQTLAASASILVTFTAGLTSGYSGILLPQLERPGSVIPGDEVTKSWLAAMAALPMAPGCLISGWMMERFGRRKSHLIICAPFLLGWIMIACANSLSLMLAGRFLTGLCVGLLGPLGPVYIGETSEPKYRGFFLAGVSLAIALGLLVAHAIGIYMTWQWTAVICSFFPVVAVVVLMLVPESPTWLISKGRLEEGIDSYRGLRGYDKEANDELLGILEKAELVRSQPVMTLKEKIINFKNPELLKPMFIMILFFITCQFSGVNAVAFYSIEIIEKSVGEGINKYLSMIIIDLVRVVMSVVACVLCKRYGRRPVCFISGIWTAISMIGLSFFLYCTGGKSANLSWIPLLCLTVYICAVSIGLVPLPWIMCGEVFPTKVKGIGSGVSSATAFAAFFIVVKTSPAMMRVLGEMYTFLAYGIVALVGTILMYFILPETKGKSLQEIEDKFRSSNRTKV